MTEPAAASRSPARAALDAFQVLTDRFHAQLGAVAGQRTSLVASGDVEALAMTVMIDAARSGSDDLRALLADIKAVGAAKAALRRRLDQAKSRRRPPGGALDAEAVVQLVATIAVSEISDEVRDMLRAQGDSRDEMGELESLRLQMAMDRASKLMSTLSNLLKQLADTQAAIVQNLK